MSFERTVAEVDRIIEVKTAKRDHMLSLGDRLVAAEYDKDIAALQEERANIIAKSQGES